MQIVFVLFCGSIYSQVLYENGPNYIANRQYFRINHDSEYFNRPDKDSLDSSKSFMRIITSSTFSNETPINLLSIQLALHSGSWRLYAEPWVVNKFYGKDILGAEFTRIGMKGRYIQSFLKYDGKYTTFKLGRFRQRWGQSYNSSLIFSLYSLPFDQASLRFGLGEWDFELFSGSFSSEMYSDSVKINRHVAGHRIMRSFLNERLHMEAGEVILYTGENRSWDIQYLSPFSLYYIDMFSPSNYLRKDGMGYNNENTLMFFSVRWNWLKNISLFSELLIDDFQIHNTGRQHNVGFKIGIDGSKTISGKSVTFEFEYTFLNSWTYLNKGQLANYENLDHAVGYPYGPDNHGLKAQIDFWVIDNLLINFEHTYLIKGANTLRDVPNKLDNINTIGDPFPRPPVNYYNFTSFSLSWWMKYGRIEAGWSNIPFSNQIAYDGNPDIDGSFYIKLQGHYTFSGF